MSTYVCTHCGWVGSDPAMLHVGSTVEPTYYCPRCPYAVSEAPKHDSATGGTVG